VGELVIVRPGERVSADGIVVGGSPDVDQSSVTGEPLPVRKTIDDDVFAGTLNGGGVLRIRVTQDPSDTVVARIVTLVAEASATKPRRNSHREDRTTVFGGRRGGDACAVRDSAGAGSGSAVHAAASDDVHDRGLAVRSRSGHHAAAAVGDRQRRTPRCPRQIRCRHGTSGGHQSGRDQDRHADHPPTLPNGFWSITMYGADFQLVKNPINRFSIGDRTPGLARNPDGSLDIYIQSRAPKGHETNWLPSPPSGQSRLNYRIYLPAAEAKDPMTLVKYLPPIKKIQ
jgi:Protein of unknown function (DUF1214)/E1-E2 ATPase